jgi:hypothetical protein
MPWPLLKPDHAPIIFEINDQSDRAAAIVAASFLEDRLAALLKVSMRDDPKVIRDMFGGHGPLGTFSAKIDLGFLINLYDERQHRVLHRIRTVRNKFAHGLELVTFGTRQIVDLCNNFEAPFSPDPQLDIAESERLKSENFDAWMEKWILHALSGPDTPRERYLIAVRMAYLNFELLVEQRNRKKKAAQAPPSPDMPAPAPSSSDRPDTRRRGKRSPQPRSSRT